MLRARPFDQRAECDSLAPVAALPQQWSSSVCHTTATKGLVHAVRDLWAKRFPETG